MILGDMGADVIKVERPGTGDDTRQWGPPWAEGPRGRESAYFLCANRNKRSITVDLKSDGGVERVRGLARDADVLLENFAPGTLDAWGLGYEALQAVNPRLIFCSITGYSSSGPDAGRPGYDFAVQARAGWMSVTGEPEGEPMKVGFALADVLAGQNAAIAILSALRERDRSGAGQHIEVALFDSALAGLINVAQAALVTGREPARYGNAHPTIVPYQAFQALDRLFVVAVGNDAQWRRLCGAIGLEVLATDERFATNPGRVEHRGELIPLLVESFGRDTAAVWLARLDEAGVPCAPVQSVGEALRDRAGAGGGGWEMAGATFGHVGTVPPPIRFSRTPSALRLPAPSLGQHTAEVDRTGWE